MLVEIKEDVFFLLRRELRAIAYKNWILTTRVQVYKTVYIATLISESVSFFSSSLESVILSAVYLVQLQLRVIHSVYTYHMVCNIYTVYGMVFFFW